jgi:hypothetical protein
MILRGALDVAAGLIEFVIIPDDETFRVDEDVSMMIIRNVC